MLECVANRHECDECGSSFKKALYLNKHKKKMHDTKEAFSGSKDTEVVDQEDWDKDPDVEIEVDSLESGRVIRKATQPLPVSAPKKARVETVTSGSLIKQAESRHRSQEQNVIETKEKEKKIEVQLMLKKTDKCVLEDTEVREDGDVVYKLTKRLNGDARVNLRDLIPDGNINSSSVEMCLKGEAQVELTFKHLQQD